MSSDRDAFLDTAAVLARALVESAIWFEDRCTWVGVLPQQGTSASGRATAEALGPDLYAGTSGVALFLAEAGALIDDHRARASALGAVRHALDHAARIPAGKRDGLYEGAIGIGYAAARVGAATDADEPASRARDMLRQWSDGDGRSDGSDVMAGCAGAVTGLAALADLLDEPSLTEVAASVGEQILRRAEVSRRGWSWSTPGARRMHNLCGYAHGTAGIGHALFELFHLTGDTRFREGGEGALAYERSWHDQSGIWPDLRGVARRAPRDAPLAAAVSWCNGAAGIAQSRLRVAELSGSPAAKSDAGLGLDGCERYALGLLRRAPGDFSLCHGAAGVGDLFIEAGNDRMQLAREIGLWGIERRRRSKSAPFVCGIPDGETPGLQLGISGIGLFYLRLAEPEIRGVSLVHRTP